MAYSIKIAKALGKILQTDKKFTMKDTNEMQWENFEWAIIC